jgi:Holliday junction resolvasome RuvABC endonuclease subunit
VAIYIGIDPGTSCGWAVLDANGKRIASGVWDLKPRRHEGGGMRYLRCRGYFEALLAGRGMVVVGYEEVRRHAGTTAAHVYGGIIAQIGSICEAREVPYAAYPVGTIKRLATGKGNASKALMKAAARERWPRFAGEHDEADALWIAEAARVALL